MITHSMKSVCALTAIVVLVACARAERQPAMAATLLDPCDNTYEPGIELADPGPGAPQALRQFVLGANADDLLKDEVKLEAMLDALGGRGANRTLKIKSIEDSAFGNGLAGVSVRSFLGAAGHTVGRGAVDVFKTVGKLEAYFYDATGTKESCLRVLMTTETRHGNSPPQSVAFRWHVFADFQVAQKAHPGDPGYNPIDVFPDADTVAISEQTAIGFERKLWARGGAIMITKVERSVNGAPFMMLNVSHPLYETTAGSCIDMMFENEPPQTLPSGATPPFYCLGRCKHPPIINTK